LSKVRAKAGANDKRTVTMEFMLVLDGTNTKKMPAFVADAWQGMRKVDSGVVLEKIDRAIDSQNLFFYAHPEDKAARMEIEDAELADLRLEKFVDKKIYMFFSVTQDIGAELWKWVGVSLGREFAVRFEECQQELAITPAEKAKGKAAVN
jgi:hypothetical protein